jgi:hypothetical protein
VEKVDAQLKDSLAQKDDKISVLEGRLNKLFEENQKIKNQSRKVMDASERLSWRMEIDEMIGSNPNKKQIEEMIGDLSNFKTKEDLQKHIRECKKSIANKLKESFKKKKEIKTVQESVKREYDHKLKIQEAKTKRLEKRLEEQSQMFDKQSQALESALELAKKYGAELYLEEKLKHHPNGPAIRTLCEGIHDKEQIDKVISKHSVASSSDAGYNSIQRRLKEGRKVPQNLVENLLQESGDRKYVAESQSSTSQVDEEIRLALVEGTNINELDALM